MMESEAIVRAELHRKALEAITAEMAITLVRTSGSPVVTDAKDFSTALLDAKGELVAFSGFVSLHIPSSSLAIEAILRKYSAEDIRPGDGFICNDPHSAGACHQADVGIAMPYFINDELVAWGYVDEHVLDIGGASVSGFAPEARDCYAEALRFTGIRFIRDSQIDPEIERLIYDNVRVPILVLNDIRSMVAALQVGGGRLTDLVRAYGIEEFDGLSELNKSLSEKLVRDVLSKLPDGSFYAESWVDYDGHGTDVLLPVDCVLTVQGDSARFTFSGAQQVDAFVNAARPALLGMAMSTLLVELFHAVPVNAGLWRPLQFELGPPGTIVNPVLPAPVTNGHGETGTRVSKLVHRVIAEAASLSEDPAIRGRAAGQPHEAACLTTLTGTLRSTGDVTVLFPISPTVGVGNGGQSVGDGMDTYAVQCSLGVGMPAVEIEEATAPMMILWRKIEPNSGGAGMNRGGQGTSTAMVISGVDIMTGTTQNFGAELPPSGIAGGAPGGATDYFIVRKRGTGGALGRDVRRMSELASVPAEHPPTHTGSLKVEDGDILVYTGGGGGGFGDPILREPLQVLKDVADGYVTLEAALNRYGVVVGPDGRLDEKETTAQRKAIRASRIPGKALDSLREQVTSKHGQVALGVGRNGGQWMCRYCGESLGNCDTNYRDIAVEVETPLARRFQVDQMRIRERPSGEPQFVLREYYCPGCGHCLLADVTLAGKDRLPSPKLMRAPVSKAAI